jgi:hypothetical protein
VKEDLCSFKYFQHHHDRPGEQVKGASAIEVWASKIFFCVIQAASQYSRRLPVTEICTGTKRNLLSWGLKVLSSESYEITRFTCMLASSCPLPFLGPGNRGRSTRGLSNGIRAFEGFTKEESTFQIRGQRPHAGSICTRLSTGQPSPNKAIQVEGSWLDTCRPSCDC